MKKIPLTQCQFALVDDRDFEWLNKWTWHISEGYACKGKYIHNKHIIYKMHRVILEHYGTDLANKYVDHVDGNTLNNCLSNLRPATYQQNVFNQKRRVDNTSGFKGVSWKKDKRKWKAYLTFSRKQNHLGYFDDIKEAALAYNVAAKEMFGCYARLNVL